MTTTVEEVDYQELDAIKRLPDETQITVGDIKPVLDYIYELLRQLRDESNLDS